MLRNSKDWFSLRSRLVFAHSWVSNHRMLWEKFGELTGSKTLFTVNFILLHLNLVISEPRSWWIRHFQALFTKFLKLCQSFRCRHWIFQSFILWEFMRLQVVFKNVWCPIFNTDFATSFSNAFDCTHSSIRCFNINWHTKRFNLVSTFAKNLDSIHNLIDDSLFKQNLHCYLLSHIKISFLNMVCNLLQINCFKIVIIVKSSCSKTSLGESDFLRSLTSFKSPIYLTTSSCICTFHTTTGCFTFSTSLTSTKSLGDSPCSWVIPDGLKWEIKIIFGFVHAFCVSWTSTRIINRTVEIHFSLPILSRFLLKRYLHVNWWCKHP